MTLAAATLLALPALAQKLSFKEKEGGVEVLADGKLFTAYIWPKSVKKPVLFPLITADGYTLTRGYPLEPRASERVDHPHHVGVWFNHGDVNGHDFWNNSNAIGPEHKGPFGTIRHDTIISKKAVGNKAFLIVRASWLDKDQQPMLIENTTYTFIAQGKTRYILRSTRLTAKTDVEFKDNKEGMLGIRVARELEHKSTKPEIFTDASGKATAVPVMNNEGVAGMYASSSGKTGDDVWGTRAEWVTLNSQINKTPVALAIVDHKDNPGFPTYWHARGYGLFAANPLGARVFSKGAESLDYKMVKGQSTTFNHLIIVQSGAPLAAPDIEKARQTVFGTK